MMRTILVIEDDPALLSLIADYLSIAGFAVDTARDGSDGLRKALAGAFDLLVLDIMLPGSDGFEICRSFRAVSEKPLVFLSARREDIDKIRGLGLGADDYMTKPFSPGELVARVQSHLARYDRLTGMTGNDGIRLRTVPPVVIRGIRLEPDSRKVSVDGKALDLTPKEYDVLYLLASSPDRVFRKEEIFTRVWGADHFGDITTVTVHIRKLREKLEQNPSMPDYIETVWGIGYRLRA